MDNSSDLVQTIFLLGLIGWAALCWWRAIRDLFPRRLTPEPKVRVVVLSRVIRGGDERRDVCIRDIAVSTLDEAIDTFVNADPELLDDIMGRDSKTLN